jgi:hypothetical protein
MIICNYTELAGGSILTHLHIEIGHAKHCRSEVVASTPIAQNLMARWVTSWYKAELTRFTNQREKAYTAVQCLQLYAPHIAIIRNHILTQPNLRALCNAIVTHQQSLWYMIPAANSPQHSWFVIIDFIIHHAYKIINPKSERSVSRPA